MAHSPLALERFNAVIVGAGAIGTALASALLQREGLQGLVLLSRRPDPATAEDARVIRVAMDAEQPETVAAAASEAAAVLGQVHLLVNTVGLLHSEQQQPEKRVRDVDPDNIARSFAVNATLVPLLAQAFGPLLRHNEPALFASLSARVGSIADNGLGGWYSYRASKAAQNMLLRTLAREWQVSHRNVTVVALHPGTVASPLSRPFVSPAYSKRVLTPQECAEALLDVMAALGPEQSGSFHDWRGEPVPW